MHYKTIKFNIKIPLNIHNFHFCGALRANSLILPLCARQRGKKFFAIFSHFSETFCPLPPARPPRFATEDISLQIISQGWQHCNQTYFFRKNKSTDFQNNATNGFCRSRNDYVVLIRIIFLHYL